ncbi:MAG: RsiV family protein [Ignavibacteria bacterium]
MKSITAFVIVFLITFSAYSQKLNITSHTIKDSSSAKKYEITAYYPQIDFGPDALMGVRGMAMDINIEIDSLVAHIINPFKEQSSGEEIPCPQPLNNMEVNYTTLYKNNGYLSFLFETYSSPRCAAHPMTFRTTFNYSYTGKGLLTVDSLFTPGSGWLEYISKYCINELKSRAKKDQLDNIDDMILSGASAKPENFNTFTVNDYTLDIHFNLYQVGPYVWGFQAVSIPWKDLLKMIDPQGPVGFLIK